MPNQNISRLIKSKRKRGRRRLSNSKSKKNKNEDDFGSLNMAELSKMLEKMPSKQRKRVMKKLKKSAKSMNLQNMVNEHNNNHVHSHNCGCSHMTEEEIPQLVNSDFDNTLPVLEEEIEIPQLVNSDNVLPTLEEKKIQNDENHIKPPDNSQLLKLILQQNIKKEEVVEEVVPVVEEVVEEVVPVVEEVVEEVVPVVEEVVEEVVPVIEEVVEEVVPVVVEEVVPVVEEVEEVIEQITDDIIQDAVNQIINDKKTCEKYQYNFQKLSSIMENEESNNDEINYNENIYNLIASQSLYQNNDLEPKIISHEQIPKNDNMNEVNNLLRDVNKIDAIENYAITSSNQDDNNTIINEEKTCNESEIEKIIKEEPEPEIESEPEPEIESETESESESEVYDIYNSKNKQKKWDMKGWFDSLW